MANEGTFKLVIRVNFNLVVPLRWVNLTKHCHFGEAVQKVIDPWDGVDVLLGHFILTSIVHAHLQSSVFFLTTNIGVPYGDVDG